MRYYKIMSETKKVLHLGQLPQKELNELSCIDSSTLATALIYSIAELIVNSLPLEEDILLPQIIQEAAEFAVELTEGVRLVTKEPTYKLDGTETLH